MGSAAVRRRRVARLPGVASFLETPGTGPAFGAPAGFGDPSRADGPRNAGRMACNAGDRAPPRRPALLHRRACAAEDEDPARPGLRALAGHVAAGHAGSAVA